MPPPHMGSAPSLLRALPDGAPRAGRGQLWAPSVRCAAAACSGIAVWGDWVVRAISDHLPWIHSDCEPCMSPGQGQQAPGGLQGVRGPGGALWAGGRAPGRAVNVRGGRQTNRDPDRKTYIQKYKHTYIHTYIHTYRHTDIHTYIPTYIKYLIIQHIRHTGIAAMMRIPMPLAKFPDCHIQRDIAPRPMFYIPMGDPNTDARAIQSWILSDIFVGVCRS